MARELVTHIWCDVCLEENEEQRPARETEPVIIGGWKPRLLALCDEHWEVYESFRNLLGELGQIHDPEVRPTSASVPRRSRPRGAAHPSPIHPPYLCRVPDCSRAGHHFANRESLQVHVRNQHGLRTKDYAEQYLTEEQRQPPSRSEDDEGGDGDDTLFEERTYQCPDCDYIAQNPQGLGAHRSAAHGYVGVKKRAKASQEVA